MKAAYTYICKWDWSISDELSTSLFLLWISALNYQQLFCCIQKLWRRNVRFVLGNKYKPKMYIVHTSHWIDYNTRVPYRNHFISNDFMFYVVPIFFVKISKSIGWEKSNFYNNWSGILVLCCEFNKCGWCEQYSSRPVQIFLFKKI